MICGYARVSRDGQTLDAQLGALKVAGADKVFQETALGGDRNRKELAKLMKALNAGDVLLVTRLDRLARSTVTFSTSCTRLVTVVQRSVPLAMPGPIRPRRMGG